MKEIQNIPIRVWPCPALHVLVWNRRYVNSAEKWAWQSNTISATPTPYVLSLLYVLINMLMNLLNKTFLWRHRDLHMLDEISLSLYYYYYYYYSHKISFQKSGFESLRYPRKKMFCPSCLCNFCPAECPHLVRALYYLWPIDRVLYFFQGDRGKVCMLLRE